MLKKYSAKKVDVDAIQWDGTRECAITILEDLEGAANYFENTNTLLIEKNVRDVLTVKEGEWIVKGELYTVFSDDSFNDLFEPKEETEPQDTGEDPEVPGYGAEGEEVEDRERSEEHSKHHKKHKK